MEDVASNPSQSLAELLATLSQETKSLHLAPH